MTDFTGTKVAPIGYQTKWKGRILHIATVVYFSFLAIERVDLLQGQGTFSLSLELLGCVVFLACYFIHIINRGGKLLFSNRLNQYAGILVAFMATVFLSVLFSADFELSARRVVLLSIYAFSGFLVVNYLTTLQTDSMISIVVKGMIFLSIVYAVFSIYDVFMWFNYGMVSRIGELLPFFQGNIWSVGATFVRARGASGDPNRAGIFMIINSYIILRYCKRPVLKVAICVINVAVLALTLSRTAALCLALYAVLQVHVSNRIRKKYLFRMVIIILLIIAIMVALYQVPLIQEAVGHTLDRLTTRDDSADEHISFIEIGITEAFSNLKIFLVGNGYGADASILGHGKYSNFHDAYVSFLAGCGLLSMVLFVLLLIHPLLKNRSQFPIVFVLILANIPYQIYIEPYFWFLLPFICVMPQLQHTESSEGIEN